MATITQINHFIDVIAPIVQAKIKEHGWGVASAIIAQAGIESAWGTSKLGSLYNSDSCFNMWGMKWKDGCGYSYKAFQTKEQKADGTYYTVTAKFRKADSVEDGVEMYFRFIESYPRYKSVMNCTDYTKYCTQIKNCGWATSLKYTTTLISAVEKYGLAKYDGNTVVYPTIRKGSRGTYVKIAQELLNQKGFNCGKVDGVFGVKTEQATKDYQIEFADSCGKSDGIIGKRTWASLLA